MSSLKNNLMIIIIITCLLLKHTICHDKGLVVVTKYAIKFFTQRTVKPKINVELPTMTTAAYDPTTQDIYVSEDFSEDGRILRIHTTNDTVAYNHISIVSQPDKSVRGLAFDHFNSTLYYTIQGGIYYVNVPVKKTREPPTGDCLRSAQNPREITVDGHNKYLYWVDSSTCSTDIVRSNLNGKDSVTLVKGLSDPRSLTVDMATKTLYWTDDYYGGVRKISSVVDGHLPELIDTKDQWSPVFIALHGRYIYCINTLYPGKLFVMSKNYPYSPKSVFEDQRKNANPIGLFVWSGFDPEEVDKK